MITIPALLYFLNKVVQDLHNICIIYILYIYIYSVPRKSVLFLDHVDFLKNTLIYLSSQDVRDITIGHCGLYTASCRKYGLHTYKEDKQT